ncbi:MAG: hypothetical protein V4850_08335 [Myxococcota bacterium]
MTTTDTPSPGGTTLLPGSGASLLVRSELMQGYVTAQAIPTAGAQLAAVANSQGIVQIFTLGDGGQVFNLYPSADSQTGWSVRPLRVPVAVQHLAVGTEIDGTVVVLACGSDNALYWKTDEPYSAWQNLGQPFGALTVQALRTGYDSTGRLMFQAIVTFPDLTQGVVRVYPRRAESPWDYVSQAIDGMLYDCVPGVAGGAPGTFLTCSDTERNNTNLTFYEEHQVQGRTFYAGSMDDILALSGTVNRSGRTEIFGLSEEGEAWYVDQDAPEGQNLVGLSTNFAGEQVTFGCIQACLLRPDDSGLPDAVQLLGVARDGTLYFANQQVTTENGLWWSPLVSLGEGLQSSAGSLTACRDAGGFTQCFAATTSGQLIHFWQDAATDWHSSVVAISYEGDLVDLVTYSSEVTVLDASGSPMPAQPMEVSAADTLNVTINGTNCVIGPGRSFSCETNGAGRVTIVTPTTDFGVAAFTVATALIPDGALTIAPDRYVQDALYPESPEVLATTLSTQTYVDANGATQPLIDMGLYGAYVPDVSQAVWSSMSLAMPEQGDAQATAKLVSKRGDTSGVQVMGRGQHGGRIDVNRVPDQFWHLEFVEGGVRYHRLRDRAECDAVAAKYAVSGGARATRSTGSKPTWGSMWNAVKRGAAEVQHVVVSVYSTVVTETGEIVRRIESQIQTMVKGILQDFANFVVGTIKEVFDLVQGVFDAIAVGMDKLLGWLGSPFDWSAVLSTHDTISGFLSNFMTTLLPGMVTQVKDVVDGFLDNVASAIPDLGEGGNQSVGATQAATMSQAGKAPGPSSNWMQNQVLNAGGGAPTAAPNVNAPPTDSDPIGTFIQTALRDLGSTFDTLVAECSAILASSRSAGEVTPNQILTAFAKMAAEGVVLSVKAVVDLAFDFLIFLVDSLSAVATTPWHIPVVSKLYKRLVGKEMTLLDVTSLALALPLTIAARVAGIDLSGLTLLSRNVRAMAMVLTPAQWFGRAPVDEATRSRLREVGFDETSSTLEQISYVMGFLYGIAQLFFAGFTWLYAIDAFKNKWVKCIPAIVALVVLAFSCPLWQGWPETGFDAAALACWAIALVLWAICQALPAGVGLFAKSTPETTPLLGGKAATSAVDKVTGGVGTVGGVILLVAYVIEGFYEGASADYLPGASTEERWLDVAAKFAQNALGTLPTLGMMFSWNLFDPYGKPAYALASVVGAGGAAAIGVIRAGVNANNKNLNHVI